jgi:isoquinoline 1-oxidoreductase beta subunit
VPVQWWRSVGSTHTAFATECFLDEIAHASGKDPYALRRALLAGRPRHLAALNLAARRAGPRRKGTARGLAVHESFNSVVAEVVELSQRKAGLRIDKVVCAVDCGVAVNPGVVAAQMESGIAYGLSAALTGRITISEGVVDQSNFHDYPVLRMAQMPRIDVAIVPSRANPTGVGEPSTPVIAPALANALLALRGKPVRSLPFSAQDIRLA